MEKSKIDSDRRIKKVNYNIGDFVLCHHPKLKKGLSQGIARKFYGPFVVVGKNDNNVDYLIRFASKPKSKIKQVHKNRLKFYFKSGLDNVKIKQEYSQKNTSDSQNTKKNVRKKTNMSQTTLLPNIMKKLIVFQKHHNAEVAAYKQLELKIPKMLKGLMRKISVIHLFVQIPHQAKNQ
ncbi:gap-Pol poly [Brachionus plicatilis]|uniref:Gap-Pol poly n=1 Tax=Brachionus plicatilis TaxID=10195 RepID=A0A3M7QP49_BRAPC|nr:gap-Pol poly [Brachionus plicatilis]